MIVRWNGAAKTTVASPERVHALDVVDEAVPALAHVGLGEEHLEGPVLSTGAAPEVHRRVRRDLVALHGRPDRPHRDRTPGKQRRDAFTAEPRVEVGFAHTVGTVERDGHLPLVVVVEGELDRHRVVVAIVGLR